mgnify:CR=1 FL=1
MLNITAVGNLVADPEQRQTPSGLLVTNFRLLVNKKTSKEEIVSQIDCSIWGDSGNPVMQYLHKGSQITVSGSGSINPFLKKDNTAGASIRLKVNEYSLPPKPKAPIEEAPF